MAQHQCLIPIDDAVIVNRAKVYKAQDQVESRFSIATMFIQVCIHIDNIYLRSEGIYYLWYTSLATVFIQVCIHHYVG